MRASSDEPRSLWGFGSLQKSRRRRRSVILNYRRRRTAANAQSRANKPENRRRRDALSISDRVLHDTLRSLLPLRCAILQKA